MFLLKIIKHVNNRRKPAGALFFFIEYADAITIENLHTQMYQNLKLTLFFLEDPFP